MCPSQKTFWRALPPVLGRPRQREQLLQRREQRLQLAPLQRRAQLLQRAPLQQRAQPLVLVLPRAPLPLPQAQTYQPPRCARFQPTPPPQERLAVLPPPSVREPAQQQALAQQRELALVREPEREKQGLQARRPPALQRSHHRIRAPRWLASSYRHASIAPIRPSKPSRSRCCASCESLGLRPKTRGPSEQTKQQRGSISYILLSFQGWRRGKCLLKHGCAPPSGIDWPRGPFCHSGMHIKAQARALPAICSRSGHHVCTRGGT